MRKSRVAVGAFLPFSISLLLLAAIPSLAQRHNQPAKREYDSHAYYVVEIDHDQLPLASSPEDVAHALGAEHVERVGELDDFYLIRAPKELVARGEDSWISASSVLKKRGGTAEPVVERDLVMERFELLRRGKGPATRLRSRSLALTSGGEGESASLERRLPAAAVVSLERQQLRLRVKRDLPVLPPSPRRSLSLRNPFRLSKREALAQDEQPAAAAPADDVISRMARLFGIVDPLWPKQWHLVNGVIEDNMINVTGVWDEGILGKGVNVAIVDDGLDMHSDDLAPNFHADGSWDYNDNTALPEPRLSDDQHGTRCAGEIAAAKNDVCGVGVAYEAGIAGIRILSSSISDADEASALNYGFQTNSIYSCSWGPPDDGKSMEAPGRLIVQAMLNGVQRGRNGKGSIFVFASGNGGAVDDQCNFDGYTNSLMSITVGAIDRKNLHPFYSEACAANMVVTYSSGSGDNIHTTDVGKNTCTDRHGGTSAAAPIAAGIFALVLEARPDLTWRDMQHLCVQTAVQINPQDPDWQMTASGRNFNHKYGFGKLDAWAIVNAAKTWELVKPQAWWVSPLSTSGQKLTADGVTADIAITKDDLESSNFELLEHVTVTVHIDHQRRGNVEVELLSPKGMKSILARPRRYDDATTGIPNWVFMTVKHWDEDPVGTWTLRVRDRQTNNFNGTFNSWSMQLWGSSIDASKATPWRIPRPYHNRPTETTNEDEEEQQDEEQQPEPTPQPEPVLDTPEDDATKTFAKPTDHLPEDHADAPGEAHSHFGDPDLPTQTANPVPGDDAVLIGGDEDGATPPMNDDVFDDSPALPGQSGTGYFDFDTPGYLSGLPNLLGSSTWMFVAGGTILVFVAGVTAFFVMKRRPRLGRGGGYDFAPQTDDEDGLAMNTIERGRGRLSLTAPGSARTRELYDAFRLDSDDEDESDDDTGKPRMRSDVAYTDEGMESFLDDPAAPLAPSKREDAMRLAVKEGISD